MVSLHRSVHKRYHWIVAAIVFLQMIVFGGIINSYSIYLIPITEGIGISRSLYSVGAMAQGLTVMFSTMATTVLFSRLGYRKVVCGSLALLGISMVLTAVCQDVWLYTISKILFGIGYGACHTAGAAWISKAWFHKHHGTVLGVITMGTGLGGSIFSVFLTDIMEKLDWRWAHFVSAGMLVVMMLIMLAAVRDCPEQIGLKPYGDNLTHAKEHRHKRKEKNWPGISVQETRKHPAFWMMNACILLLCICVTLTSQVLVPHFQDHGYSAMEAAKYQSLYMFTLAIAKLLCGWVSEKIGGKALGVICIACAAIGQWWMTDLSNPILAYVAVAIFSVSMTMTSVTVPLLTESVFGTETSTGILGAILGFAALSSVISAPITNVCYDLFGSYNIVFKAAAVGDIAMIGLLIAICVIFGKKEKEYRRSVSA